MQTGPKALALGSEDIEALYLASYTRNCEFAIRDPDRIHELLALLDEAQPAFVDIREVELRFRLVSRDGSSRDFYAGSDWVLPAHAAAARGRVSGWRLPSQSFHAAFVLASFQGLLAASGSQFGAFTEAYATTLLLSHPATGALDQIAAGTFSPQKAVARIRKRATRRLLCVDRQGWEVFESVLHGMTSTAMHPS